MTSTLDAPSTIHIPTLCDQCGKFDPDPKLHYGGWGSEVLSVHHDCAPQKVIHDIIGSPGHNAHPLIAAKIFEASREGGKKGEELRGLIGELHAQGMPDHGDATMLFAASFANDVVDAVLANGASGTFLIGATTYTLPFKIIFLSTLSTATTQGTPWSGGSYAPVSLAGLATTAASVQSKASTSAITETNSPATTWADNEIVDSTGTPKRVALKGTPSLAKTINSGDTATIPSGSLTATAT
jgi:hypothetical protein